MSKSRELINTTTLVRAILRTNIASRSSDSYLYLKVIEQQAMEKGIDLSNISVPVFLIRSSEWGFVGFETVRRTRQKLQSKFPELAACHRVEGFRAENEEDFREYARTH